MLIICLGMQISAAQRSESAPTVPTQRAAEVTPRAASDSAVSRKREYKEWRDAVSRVWETEDVANNEEVTIVEPLLSKDHLVVLSILCFGEDVSVSLEVVKNNFLPEGYQQPSDIFADMETQKSDVQSAVSEISLPTFHACRPDAGDTTYYVRKPRPLDSKGIQKDESPSGLLNGDKQRVDLYNKLGVRRKRVTSPSSRFPAEAFHQFGKVGEDFSPVEQARDDHELQFALDLE
jgi:hypothetical protein